MWSILNIIRTINIPYSAPQKAWLIRALPHGVPHYPVVCNFNVSLKHPFCISPLRNDPGAPSVKDVAILDHAILRSSQHNTMCSVGVNNHSIDCQSSHPDSADPRMLSVCDFNIGERNILCFAWDINDCPRSIHKKNRMLNWVGVCLAFIGWRREKIQQHFVCVNIIFSRSIELLQNVNCHPTGPFFDIWGIRVCDCNKISLLSNVCNWSIAVCPIPFPVTVNTNVFFKVPFQDPAIFWIFRSIHHKGSISG
mmetsp:Transcript_34293/g.83013  ORF Transcript_34293/g.83013 Transcript_34293/m.83013 type:complete len:252 (+) Transcript_34293:892-1647(+)